MPLEDKAYVSSLLIKGHKYEPNINTIEENGQTTDLYKVRLHFNDLQYDLCIAIGDIKKLDNVDYKYVYVVKYGSVISKIGIYEFIHGSNTNEYKEASMILFDNFADSLKLNELVQSKDEYILNVIDKNDLYNKIKNDVIKYSKLKDKGYEKMYSTTLKYINKQPEKELLESTLKFYDKLNNSKNIDDIKFIKDGKLDHSLINKYKEKYESLTYNDFLRMIFANTLKLLDELDEFEGKNILFNKESNNIDETIKKTYQEVKYEKEPEQDEEPDEEQDEEEVYEKESEDEEEKNKINNKNIKEEAEDAENEEDVEEVEEAEEAEEAEDVEEAEDGEDVEEINKDKMNSSSKFNLINTSFPPNPPTIVKKSLPPDPPTIMNQSLPPDPLLNISKLTPVSSVSSVSPVSSVSSVSQVSPVSPVSSVSSVNSSNNASFKSINGNNIEDTKPKVGGKMKMKLLKRKLKL